MIANESSFIKYFSCTNIAELKQIQNKHSLQLNTKLGAF